MPTPASSGWAMDDEAATDDDLRIDVLANDTPPAVFDYDSLVVISLPAWGETKIKRPGEPDTVIEYSMEDEDESIGTDSFTYRICDIAGNCDTATVTVTLLDD